MRVEEKRVGKFGERYWLTDITPICQKRPVYVGQMSQVGKQGAENGEQKLGGFFTYEEWDRLTSIEPWNFRMGQKRRPVSCGLARHSGCRMPLFHLLPLSLFSGLKFLKNRQSLLQSAQPGIERLLPFSFVGRQLRIKVFPVRRGRHSGAKNRLHQERMVWFEGIDVCRSERYGELVRRVRQVVS